MAESFCAAIALFVDSEVTRIILASVENLSEIINGHLSIVTSSSLVVGHVFAVFVHAWTTILCIIKGLLFLVEHENRSILAPDETVAFCAAVGTYFLIGLVPRVPINFILAVVTICFILFHLLLSLTTHLYS